MTPILPMTIEPAGDRAFGCIVTVLLTALLTSAMWYTMLSDEREIAEQLLTEKMASQMRVDQVTIRYMNGRSMAVTLKEKQ